MDCEVCIGVLGIWAICYFTSRDMGYLTSWDMGYLPFDFQGYGIFDFAVYGILCVFSGILQITKENRFRVT